ncbi:MAG TPA: thiamine pyrophosphate-binding protein, partial [Solirubrobacteraceae bacterium]|nr:thiamine pyrophosphate-binding protein [Solirubrobacteraceae bacterium]
TLADVPQIAFDPYGTWHDPASVTGMRIHSAPPQPDRLDVEPGWLESWSAVDAAASSAIDQTLGDELSEPLVARKLGEWLPTDATVFVASSMPVRDVEEFVGVRDDPPRFLSNRGANGIDGTVSSGFGAAAASDGPVVLLIGDVALAHDIGGLLAARRLELVLTIVLIDNGGGGIFDFLPIAQSPMARGAAGGGQGSAGGDSGHPGGAGRAGGAGGMDGDMGSAGGVRRGGDPAEEDLYTRHVATPTGLDFAQAARLYGLEHETVTDVLGFRAALERALTQHPRRAGIIEVRTDRAENVALHRRAWAAVAGVLDGGV